MSNDTKNTTRLSRDANFHSRPAAALAALFALTLLALFAGAATAQCPVPPLSPPVIDGSLDPIYSQRGFITDYVANNVNASARLYQIDDVCVDSQFIYLGWEIDLGFVDNSYGLNLNKGALFPWPKGHSFFDLTESDGQRLQILNVCGEDVVDIFMDYIDGPNVPGPEYGTPSGYEVVQPSDCGAATCAETMKFLINGGDWTMYTYDTSIGYNLNDLGFCTNDGPGGAPPDCDDLGTDLLVDSPPWLDEDNFVPTAAYAGWEYKHIYEIRIDRAVFSTASCPQGTPALIRTDPVELHASPSKIGESPVDLFRSSSAIGDYVWFDADRDGVQDTGETGLGNVTVDLYRDADGDGVFEPDIPVIDGGLDMDLDGDVDGDDDGTLAGASVIDGLLDLDGDGIAGETNGDDSGTLNGVRVIDGRLDVDDDFDVDAADDGIFANEDGGPLASTVTDASGRYLFQQIAAGDYFVDVTDDNGILAGFALTTGPQSQTDPTGAIDLPLGDEYLDADFGYAPADLTKAVIGDYIWSDADQDGIQDPGEAGIGGVTVDLVDLATMTVVATTVTGPDGRYLFTGVDPGDYFVDVTDTAGVLSGYSLTSGPQSEPDPSQPFHVSAGDSYLNADFGYFNPLLGSIGNQVWFDADEDAFFDSGAEPGIGAVTVALIDDADQDGIWDPGELIIATTTTAADGTYTFPGLVVDDGGGDGDADYLVWISDTKHILGDFLSAVFLPLGSTADNESKIPAYAVDIAPGAAARNDVTADFGYLIDNPDALIGDRVWYDKDGDGVQDGDEPGIEGVRLILYNDANKNGQIDSNKDKPIATRTTNINGNYYFQRLDFDNNSEGYIVVVSEFNPIDIFDGLLDLDGDGTAGGPGDDGTVDGVSIIDGQLDLDGDGVIETNGDDSGTVSGFKVLNGRLDLDRDGVVETNGDDSRFGPLKNFAQTGDPDEAGTCVTCDEQGASLVSTANTIDLTIDFGYDSIGILSIGDTVYHDLDGDGMQDAGEPGLELITLELYEDLDGDGVVDPDEPLIATEVTDANGGYLFDGLVSGDYIVAVTDDNSILVGYTQTQGSPFEPVASSELSTLDKDFGFVRDTPASISDFVWEDLDGDGLQGGGEPGIGGVTVNLYDPGADGQPGGGDDVLVASTVTDGSGLYSFTVQPGRYFVEFVPPAGFAFTARDQGANDSVDSDPDPATGQATATTLIIGENDPTWDAGLYRPVSVGDFVWFETDGDGVQEAGEAGIANVTLELWDAGADGMPGGGDDTLLATATTDSNGLYLFDQRPPGDYFVDLDESTLPTGLLQSGGTDPSSVASLLSGQQDLSLDFGYTPDLTAALISRFEGFAEGGRLALEWETASEVGTVGFLLYRRDAAADDWVRVTDEILPAAVGAHAGAVYRFVDAGADPDEPQRYLLVEVESRGGERRYGPFGVDAAGERSRAAVRSTPVRGQVFRVEPRRMPPRAEAVGGGGPRRGWVPVGTPSARGRSGGGQLAGGGTQPAAGGPGETPRVKVLVEERGMLRVEAADLAAAMGVPAGAVGGWIRGGRLVVESGGEPVSWSPAAAGDAIEIYGEPATGIYTRRNVYWLSRGRGSLMAAAPGGGPVPAPGGSFRHLESYESDRFAATVVSRDPEADYWFWEFVTAGHSVHGSKSFALEVPDPAAGAAGAELTVRLFGATDTPVAADHLVEVRVNGTVVGESSWDGIAAHEATFALPAGALAAGANSVEVTGLLDSGAPYSIFYVDSFELAYQRRYRAAGDRLAFRGDANPTVTVSGFSSPDISVFDVTDPRHPRVVLGTTIDRADGFRVSLRPESRGRLYLAVAGGAYLAPAAVVRDRPSALLAETEGADYVVVAGAGLLAGAEELAAFREATGFRTLVADLEDIYDELNHGRASPHAIRDFLVHASATWRVAPEYLALVGAGTFDYRDILGLGGNLVPPLMAATPWGLFASDNRFGDLEGGDGAPEVAVGRIPARDAGELASYLAKLRRYEGELGGAGGERVLMLADHPDSAGDFPSDSNAVEALLPAGAEVERVHLPDYETLGEARADLLEALDSGAGWVNFVGHGGLDRMAKAGLLLASDVGELTPGHRLPVFASLTCAVGRFEIPGFESLAEELLRGDDRGAVAVWSPTGLSFNERAIVLNEELFASAFDAGPKTLGGAVREALAAYAEEGFLPFMLDIYNLLGDPALELP